MSERCPLGSGLYWESGDGAGSIPDICRERCEVLWDEATKQPPHIDTFDPECAHDVEYEDSSLQRAGGARRGYSILNACSVTGEEVFSEEWEFTCPND